LQATSLLATLVTPSGARILGPDGRLENPFRTTFSDNPLTDSDECLLSTSMERMHNVETRLRGTTPSSVGAHAYQPGHSLDERRLVCREAGNTGIPAVAGS